MNLAFLRLLLLLTVAPCLWAEPAGQAWPVTAEGLSPDPAWVWGRLDNGLRYVVRRNSLPAGHISFRFCVEVGFAHETKAERGLAHFVEHMAFNGTRHFPGESLIGELQKHGVNIGPELSAFTFLTHTLYYLDAPVSAPDDLERWFTVIRDFADGLRFEAKQVKRERGVIASEARDRQSPATRADAARRRFLYPAANLGNPTDANVDKVDRNDLRNFYDKWYRPERMILAVVGDVEPAQLEALVQRHFASLQARAFPAPKFDPGFVDNPAETTADHLHDPKVNGIGIEVVSVLPNNRPDNLVERRRWLASGMLIYLLNVRLQQIARNQPARVQHLAAQTSSPTPYGIETSVLFSGPSLEWQFGVTTIDQELRRSFEYTFTADEVREARAVVLTGHEQAVKSSATRHSSGLAADVMQQALWHAVVVAPADNLRLAREWLPQIDALEMNRAWRSLWQNRRSRIFSSGFHPAINGTTMLQAAFNESLRRPVAPPEVRPELPFAYTALGPPGRVRRRDYLPELDIHILEFENGVRANLKRTTFEAARVRLAAQLGRGMLTEPEGQAGLGMLTAGTFLNGALGRHKPEELRRLMSTAMIELAFNISEDHFGFAGGATPDSLEQLLQLISAYITDPGWDREAAVLASARLDTYLKDQNYTPEGVIGQHLFRILSDDDARYTSPKPERLKTRSMEEMRQWLDARLRTDPLEIGLVGDFDPEEAVAILSRTVGTLPARNPQEAAVRPVTLIKTARPQLFTYQGEANRAGIEIVWPLERCDDIRVSRQIEVLDAILAGRLRQKVREDLGAAYTPEVSHWKSEVNRDAGYLMAYITVKPKDTARLTKLIVELGDTLARKGATAAEFAQARQPILTRTVANQKDNDYWVNNIIARIQGQPEVRQWPLTRVRDLEDITVTEINALARSILPSSRAMVFSATPERK